MKEVRYLPPGTTAAPKVPGFPWITTLLALLYGASPLDLIPDVIPLLGWSDDVVVAILGLLMIVRFLVKRKAAVKLAKP